MRPDAAEPAPPRARWTDQLQVAWLLVKTVLAFIPYVVGAPLSPLICPWIRRRLRRRLRDAPEAELADPAALWATLQSSGIGPRRIFLVAGEASGDRMAASLVSEIRKRFPQIEIVGFAGPASAAAGARLHRDLTANAVMGVFAVAASLRFWWGVCVEALARFRAEPPDLLLTVDFPGLNVRMAEWAHRRGIRTVHVVAPQVWAHGPWRILRWRKAVDHLLSTMPFEPRLFEASRIHTTYVGHPLFEAPLPPPRAPARRPTVQPTIELWPGSRGRELRSHIPILAAVAVACRQQIQDATFVVPLAHARQQPEAEALWRQATSELACPVWRVGPGEPDPSLLGAIVTSGTATAQVAVDLIPEVVFYRVALPTRILARVALSTPWICLANLVAGRLVAPEHLVGGPAAAPRLWRELWAQVEGDAVHARTRASLETVRQRLSAPDVASRAAALVVAELA